VGARPLQLADRDLAHDPLEHHLGDAWRARPDRDRELVVAEPLAQALGVALELEPRQPDGARRMGCRRMARERGPLTPFDEERERRLGGGCPGRDAPLATSSGVGDVGLTIAPPALAASWTAVWTSASLARWME
jgi:hypothetical protein